MGEGWLPRPPAGADAATLRAAVDAVLEVVHRHRQAAAFFNARADELARDGRDPEVVASLRGRADSNENAGDHIVEALVAALGLWDEYEPR
jgi:hypothetical protein